MAFNPYYPYPQSPYGQPNYGSFQQPQMQQNTYAFVNGIEGAKSFPMQPNQTVMLMDSEQPIAYMKQSNNMGQATIKYFKLLEVSEDDLRNKNQAPKAEYVLKADFDDLVAKVNSMMKKGEQPNG